MVDDGSTDGTQTLISRLAKTASFSIRSFYKENGGKHTAMNLGFKNSFGKLIIVFDSDDWCVSTALEKIAALWDGLSAQEQNNHSTVSVLKVYTNGTVVGDRFPRNLELKTYTEYSIPI